MKVGYFLLPADIQSLFVSLFIPAKSLGRCFRPCSCLAKWPCNAASLDAEQTEAQASTSAFLTNDPELSTTITAASEGLNA
jgi:hypothetical protein